MIKGDNLIQLIIFKDENKDDHAIQLLEEFAKGYPIEKLSCLLRSQSNEVLKTGIWIASELGGKCRSLIKDIALLLNHEVKYVRFFTIDSLLTCSNENNSKIIADVLLHLNDNESSIRWKTIDFIVRASASQLNSALRHFDNNSDHFIGINLLLDAKDNKGSIEAFIKHKNPLLRKYGVAAAARIPRQTKELLQLALNSNDQDIKNFAKELWEDDEELRRFG